MVTPTAAAPPSYEEIRRAPKALLHDHLDGGLRPATIMELADAVGLALPATDVPGLAHWFSTAAGSGSLERYLETFVYTVGVMQTPDALHRVARECALDLAADGVVYAEVRFAPEQHLERGLQLPEVVEAVLAGFEAGCARGPGARARRSGSAPCSPRCGMPPGRRRSPSWRSVTATSGWSASTSPAPRPATRPPGTLTRSSTCSGRTSTSPSTPARHSGCRRSGRRLQWCGADRLGHGVRIVDDIDTSGPDGPRLGRLSAYVRDKRIPLELCPSSNVQTGAAASIAEHPIGLLRDLRFRVTVNTDNRLMSGTSMSREMALLGEAFG